MCAREPLNSCVIGAAVLQMPLDRRSLRDRALAPPCLPPLRRGAKRAAASVEVLEVAEFVWGAASRLSRRFAWRARRGRPPVSTGGRPRRCESARQHASACVGLVVAGCVVLVGSSASSSSSSRSRGLTYGSASPAYVGGCGEPAHLGVALARLAQQVVDVRGVLGDPSSEELERRGEPRGDVLADLAAQHARSRP